MDYLDLPRILKRYSFDEKVRICHYYSLQTMSPQGPIPIEKLFKSASPLPWNLETFFLLSIKADEWGKNDFQGKNEKKFYEIMNCISSYIHPKLSETRDQFVDRFIISTAATQFESQKSILFALYRYNYYFNFKNDKVDVINEFYKKFGCDYSDFSSLGYILWMLFCTKKQLPIEFLTYLINNYPVAKDHLLITREKYIVMLDEITDDISNYMFCLRPSYLYPFLNYDNVAYIPLPHLLIRSVTTSLLYRLTEENTDLLEKIGKEVFEQYLYSIIDKSGIFDEVYGELKYKTSEGIENRSLDILTRIGTDFILFDSKSTTPRIHIRTFNQQDIEDNVEILAEHCVQVYNHLTSKFQLYNPFISHKKINRENIWGVIVVREDSYINREQIYQTASKYLNIFQDSDEYNWLCSHIGITELYNIESFCFTGTDIISEVKRNSKTGRYNDYWFISATNSKIVNQDLLDFSDTLVKRGREFIEEAKKQRYIT